MSKIVTVKELEDCALDAQTFGDAANGAPGVKVKARLGRVYWTLATYDKRFNDRADLFDKMYVDYDSTLATKAKAFDDSLVKKNKEFDDARVAQVKKYDDTLAVKVKAFDDSRNAQILKYDQALTVKTKAFDDSLVNKNKEFDDSRNAQITKYNQTMDAKVIEYDLKIDSVDADLRKATDTANTAKKTADEAKVTADTALKQTELKPATAGVLGGVKIGSGLGITAGGVLSTIVSVDDLEVLLYSPIPYSKNIAPTGFLIMMGQSISSSQHPKLYARYGAKLPDPRAQVLRGWDNGRGIDVGRTLLSEQGDAIRNITGSTGKFIFTNSTPSQGEGALSINKTSSERYAGFSDSSGGSYSLDFSASNSVPTALENRVKSIAVNYIVKAG